MHHPIIAISVIVTVIMMIIYKKYMTMLITGGIILCIFLLSERQKSEVDTIIIDCKCKDERMRELIFSVYDFRDFNRQSFSEMLTSIDIVNDIYDVVNIDNTLANKLYGNAEAHAKKAVISMESLIHTIPHDKNVMKKLNIAANTLKYLLDEYLKKILEKNKETNYENGLTSDTIAIDTKFEPYNSSYDV